MNALERVLQDDLNHLVDRIAAATHEGVVAGSAELRPDLLLQLAASEARLSSVRHELLKGYSEWRDALEDCADLWALADLATVLSAGSDRRAA
jgi:hypothetical protein